MFHQPARITVQNDWFCRHIHHIIYSSYPRCHIHQLYIRFSLRSRITERGYPHRVKLIEPAFVSHHCFFSNQAGQSAVHFYCLHNITDIQQLPQPSAAKFRHSKPLPRNLIDLLNFIIPCVRHFDQLPAILFQIFYGILTQDAFRSLTPVISMYHIVRFQFLQNLIVHDLVLYHYFGNPLYFLYHFYSLLKRNCREPIIAYHLVVAEYAHDNLSISSRLIDNIDMPFMNLIGTKTCINHLHRYLRLNNLLFSS